MSMLQIIEASELSHWLENDRRPNPILLDVRELSEIERCQIPGSLHMPMNSVPIRLEELDQDVSIVCICHHGTRSKMVAQFLLQHGFKSVFNLIGGIHAWATQVDSTMETY